MDKSELLDALQAADKLLAGYSAVRELAELRATVADAITKAGPGHEREARDAVAEVRRLQAENDRYRKALEEIAANTSCECFTDTVNAALKVVEQIRRH